MRLTVLLFATPPVANAAEAWASPPTAASTQAVVIAAYRPPLPVGLPEPVCGAPTTLMRMTGTVAPLNLPSPLAVRVQGARLSAPPHMITAGPVRVPRRSAGLDVAVNVPSSCTGQVTTTRGFRRAAL